MYRLSFLLLLFFSHIGAQDSTTIKKILAFQEELNKEFASEEKSPLTPKDFKTFKELDFFDIDTSYSVLAKFIRTPYETPFIMKTTTNREPIYVKYGEAHFVLQEKKWILNIYQSQGLKTQPEYEDYLFLPFTDLSNGETSYGGGRFIDLKIPEDDIILIDFNTAYNPYCAYSARYSCPIPPEENHLELEIPVGVKKYNKHEANK
ncbi:DUF1684 domain-containing protein [Aquimarina sp. BL5]|uniref:DUF1684 domain-containing protein n=1 Tax=Aquimarina sp. BL5 TaxID=1714860 RepID=UPI000E54454B|nr:DUF1684 domain-containing protein [Aquimarina sp. BL5]AXT53235.1 DUF1684 domain-containing protein [Aquimarina sp. BL5]RKM92424.1 DUF1684 domain-containing protein [Aquimarina sp. BL5]